MISVDGKIVLITGAGKPDGQGSCEAKALAEGGATVYITDVLDDEGQATADALGESVHYLHLDVTCQENWTEVVSEIVANEGHLDGLVNNAGVWSMGGIREINLEEYRQVIDVNQIGPFLGTKAVADVMAEGGGGSIVNIGSAASNRVGVQYWHNTITAHAYTVTKWAVHGMTKATAMEFAPLKIRVNSIHPGPIETSMMDGDLEDIAASVPMQRLGQPRDIADMVLFLISDSCTYISGAEIAIDGAATV